MKYVQAIINNVNFDSSLEEVYVNRCGWSPAEIIINNSDYYQDDFKKKGKTLFRVTWTVRPWMKAGDIVFFMCGKTSAKKAHKCLKQLEKEINKPDCKYTAEEIGEMQEYLKYGTKICDQYAGYIFAIGMLSGTPYYEAPTKSNIHWRSRVYAPIENIYYLKEKPISVDEISDIVTIAYQTAITPIYGKEFETLLNLVKASVELPQIYNNLNAVPEELSVHENQDWLSLVNKHKLHFHHETEFRTLFVDSFLGSLSTKPEIYRECACYKSSKTKPSYVDNVIWIGNRLLPVEIKLNIQAEKDLKGQVKKYCNLTHLYLEANTEKNNRAKDTYRGYVLIIDTNGIYLYKNNEEVIIEIISWNDISSLTQIATIRNYISAETTNTDLKSGFTNSKPD